MSTGVGAAQSGVDLGGRLQPEARARSRARAGLFKGLYPELRRIAGAQVRTGSVDIGATALLHEAYLEICGRDVSFPDRARFLAYATCVMRGLVVDRVRASRSAKRGGGLRATSADEAALEGTPARELERLRDALEALAAVAPALSELVDLKFFHGCSLRQIAAARGVSERTIQRDWAEARRYLRRLLVR